MYTQVEMKMLSANYIWLIRDPAHTEATEGMETQKCCVVEQLLEVLCKQTGHGEAGWVSSVPDATSSPGCSSDNKVTNFS